MKALDLSYAKVLMDIPHYTSNMRSTWCWHRVDSRHSYKLLSSKRVYSSSYKSKNTLHAPNYKEMLSIMEPTLCLFPSRNFFNSVFIVYDMDIARDMYVVGYYDILYNELVPKFVGESKDGYLYAAINLYMNNPITRIR